MKLTKEDVLKALREGRVSYTVFHKDGRVEGPIKIPSESTKPQQISSQNNLAVFPELPHTRV